MYTKKEKLFIFVSCILSLLHAFGYFIYGLNDNFYICIVAMIVLDLLYIPAAIIKSNKIFPFYLAVFSIALIYITAFITSELFNNYSALLCLFVAVLIKPKYKNWLMALYLIASAIAFCIAHDEVYFMVIISPVLLSIVYSYKENSSAAKGQRLGSIIIFFKPCNHLKLISRLPAPFIAPLQFKP